MATASSGVQTEVQILLNQLSTLLPNSSGVVDGTVKTSLSVKTNWTQAQLKAAYNWQFVANDGSLGVHNAPFATGLLKASIANLTGVSVAGGLPDAWEIQYFGSITNANGAPNAVGAAGIPNWLEYALGVNPNVAGVSYPRRSGLGQWRGHGGRQHQYRPDLHGGGYHLGTRWPARPIRSRPSTLWAADGKMWATRLWRPTPAP